MIKFNKIQEPSELLQYRKQPYATYDSMPAAVKDPIRKSLATEQGYICAYCNCRVSDSSNNTKIEHIKPRSNPAYKELQLDYKNMLLVCPGALSESISTCDTSKSDQLLSFDPQSQQFISSLKYRSNGEICSDNELWDKELNSILNLNAPIIKANRQHALQELLSKLRTKGINAQNLKKYLTKIKAVDYKGRYCEYPGYLAYFIAKRLRRYPK